MKSDRIKVLIGDDTAGDGVKYASMLRDMGIFAYTRRKEGRVLFESIMNDEPDVVVVDLTLPDMDAIILMHNIIDTVGERRVLFPRKTICRRNSLLYYKIGFKESDRTV